MKKRILSMFFAFCFVISAVIPAGAAETGSSMTVSDAGINLIEGFEGYSQYAQSGGSKWYIGYGTACGENDYPNGISKEDAEKLLKDALSANETSINSFLTKYNIELTQNQYDALVSFTYNLGSSWMDPSNRISGYLIGGIKNYKDIEVVNAIGAWCHTGTTVNDNLVVRRLAEAKLYLYGDYGNSDSHDFTYIIYDAGGGNVDHDIVFYEKGKPYGTLQAPQRSGYIFKGWRTDTGKQISADDIASDNLKVSANWAAETAVSNPYSDVSSGDWFYSYVSDLSCSGVIGGYPDGTFKANNTVTCGEALKLILRAAGYGAQAATGSHWASGYLKLAVSDGLADEKAVSDLDSPISRLLIAQIAAKALNLPVSQIQSPFSDTSDGYVLALYNAGIIEGSSDNGVRLFKPDSSLTRAEISAIVWRINNTEKAPKQQQTIQYGSYTVDVLPDVPVASYDPDSFRLDNSIMHYDKSGVETKIGIDVSEYQGTIDWQKVKASGVDYAIIRLGYRGYTSGGIYLDKNFDSNIKGALDAGVEVGVYFFSQAITPDEAKDEANFVLSHIKGYNVTYPVTFDWEVIGKNTARTYGLDTDTLCKSAASYCDTIANAGYKPMIYFNSYEGYVKYDLSRVLKYDFWFAQYSQKPSFYYNYQMWQYASSGKVDGISGLVDMNICFKNY
ncbi:MAG: GH25 family lysozyme [Bacillota bacterium]|nr:GH25 family lysozyme [Bacillota bacterium]